MTHPESRSAAGKYRHIALCCLPQIVLGLLAAGAWGRGYWLLLPAVFLLVVVPVLDQLTGWQDDRKFQRSVFSAADVFVLRWNTRLYVILYMTAVVLGAKSLPHLTPLEAGFLLVSLSLIAGIAFAATHEILHCKDRLDQWLQAITTVFLFYPHYKIIHTQSHHAHAATEHDKNTAWREEGIYGYLLRTIPESMIKSWQLEVARIKKQKAAPRWSFLQNRMLTYLLTQAGLLIGLFCFCGLGGLLFYLGHVLGAHVVLESVNYIQHYGLLRKHDGGEYEMTAAEHSWDTYHFFSSYVTFRVGHHSCHHISAKPYYLLTPEADAPKLPTGYFWAIAMVLVPPWWRRVIDPKLCSQQVG